MTNEDLDQEIKRLSDKYDNLEKATRKFAAKMYRGVMWSA